MKTVEDEFDPRRDAKAVKDSIEVIFDDFLTTRGLSALRVTLLCYAISLALAIAGWLGLRGDATASLLLTALILGALLAGAVHLGAVRARLASPGSYCEGRVVEGKAGELS